jgi:sporulation protein YlmC with PRC-barrel domain
MITRISILHLFLLAACCAYGAAPANPASPAKPVRLDEILWRDVSNAQGEQLGSVSDLLVQMPSGRIVFVAVDPSEPFQRPKAVPPAALRFPGDNQRAFTLDIPSERWREAPRLDWDAALVIKNTAEGGKIYGYYQQTWAEPDRTPPWGMTVVARPNDSRSPDRYVSLKRLLLEQVETHAGNHVGYIQDFVFDWPAKRATHAVVSNKLTPSAEDGVQRFAIPLPLLNPPVLTDAITVNSPMATFHRAANWPRSGMPPAEEATAIYRYPAPTPGAGG